MTGSGENLRRRPQSTVVAGPASLGLRADTGLRRLNTRIYAQSDRFHVPVERVSTWSSIASDHRWTSSSFAANAGLT